jgi:hypothetical protein
VGESQWKAPKTKALSLPYLCLVKDRDKGFGVKSWSFSMENALHFIESVQEQDGGFKSFSGTGYPGFHVRHTYNTTFVPALVLNALVDVPGSETIRDHVAHYLLQQHSKGWAFNYWAADSPMRKSHPYPDDLDDTFCAFIALQRHNAELVDGVAQACAVKILLAAESQVGGPYRTWLVPPTSNPEWLDVDVAVNANVGYFLRLLGSRIPRLKAYLAEAVQNNQLQSPYYPSPYPLIYYLARYNPEDSRLVDLLMKLRQKDGTWDTSLQTALAVTALTYLQKRPDVPEAREFLLATQAADGSWPIEAFCIDPTRQKTPHYHGAPVLSTALALEALARTDDAPKVHTRQTSLAPKAEKLYESIVAAVYSEFDSIGGEVAQTAREFLDKMLSKSIKHEIVLLPYFFAEAMEDLEPDENLLLHLGKANLYGWLAYTIYDDFLDDEGTPKYLSAANVAQRGSLASFGLAVPNATFQRHVAHTFNTIDSANAWEVARCRFATKDGTIQVGPLPHYEHRQKLAERSLGHALTPLGLLVASGLHIQGKQVADLLQAFKQYLIARQLSDDLHDWERDIRAGHISYPVAAILEDLSIQPGEYQLEELVTNMQRQFWNHTITRLCDDMDWHIAAARRTRLTMLKAPHILDKLLDDIAGLVQVTRTKQTEAKQFLDTYRSPMA